MTHSVRSTLGAAEDTRSSADNPTVRAMAEFQAVASKADDATSIYRILRPFWALTSLAHLVEPAEKVLSLVPSSRW
ncbi:unnamed protein product [Toxocara canis]|uniref:Methyltransferase n=1 Tax=Toxocara canis TaxID=6265 RepID=A0A183V1R2_TOXCA|nr:unnamed protein product [Toxocara canis]